MKYPCRECLVRPACTQKCDPYKAFINMLSNVWSPITIMLTCIALIVSWFVVLINYGEPTMLYFMKCLWISCFCMNLLIDTNVFRRSIQSGYIIIILAPIMTPFLIVAYTLKKKYKRA